MKICLGEIERCQKTSSAPNFIVLLGDHYGWRPLPTAIPADYFEQIVQLAAEVNDRALLSEWYRCDNNAEPRVYCLQPRTGVYIDYGVWERQVERPLHSLLLQTTGRLTLSPEQHLKYTASATEQEIAHGALRVEDA